MGWLTLNKKNSQALREAMEEVDQESSHRAIAIACGAFVEDHLKELIFTRIVHDERGTTVREMFQPSGTLGPVDKVDSQTEQTMIQHCFWGGGVGTRRSFERTMGCDWGAAAA